jgi:hypothetical protein
MIIVGKKRNMIKKYLIISLLLYAFPTYSTISDLILNPALNLLSYLIIAGSRCVSDRLTTESKIYHTVADFAPLIEVAITESGLAQKGINNFLASDDITKQKIVHSLQNGARATLGIAILNACIQPYVKEITKEQANNIMKHRLKRRSIDIQSLTVSQDRETSDTYYKSSWDTKTGIPFVSPAKNALIYTGTYMATDLAIQSETAQKAIDKIPGARTIHDGIKNNVNIEPGTGAALLTCGLVWLVRSWMNN